MKRIWGFFSSITLTIVLAAGVCVTAAWGSILSVRHPRFYSSLDQSVLIPRLLSGGAEELGLTLWIYILIFLTFLFTVNTFVCTVDKVAAIARQRLPVRAFFPHIVHVGFLIAVLGHLVGSVWGFRSPGNVLYEGTPLKVPHAEGLSVRLDGVTMEQSPGGGLESLKTRVTLLEEDMEVLTDEIEINGPIIYKGMAFYHMDQGTVTSGLVLGAGEERKEVDFYGKFTLKSGSALTLGDIYPDFKVDKDGRAYSASGEFRNPYIEIISESGETGYLPVGYSGGEVLVGGEAIRLLGYTDSAYVVLTINKDPGIWFIISGSAVLVVGMVLLLFFRGSRTELVRRPSERTGAARDL